MSKDTIFYMKMLIFCKKMHAAYFGKIKEPPAL